jgi:hypothetical protein
LGDELRKLAIIIVAWCGSLICSPVHAKTFVGVLWPLFGAPAAPGLVEFVADLKTMPDVEVSTYPFEQWQTLADEIEHQPVGTHTVVIGYSLGANNAVRLANQAKYVDLIIALQPSLLTTTPTLTGNVGRMVEFYNPNPLMTFGGMGSKKLAGGNIEYFPNNDNHIAAPYNSDFRSFTKTEIAKFAADNGKNVASLSFAPAKIPKPLKLASAVPTPGEARPTHPQKDVPVLHSSNVQIDAPKIHKPAVPQPIAAAELPKPQPENVAFLNGSSRFSNADAGFERRQLTVDDMSDYVRRTYQNSSPVGFVANTR